MSHFKYEPAKKQTLDDRVPDEFTKDSRWVEALEAFEEVSGVPSPIPEGGSFIKYFSQNGSPFTFYYEEKKVALYAKLFAYGYVGMPLASMPLPAARYGMVNQDIFKPMYQAGADAAAVWAKDRKAPLARKKTQAQP